MNQYLRKKGAGVLANYKNIACRKRFFTGKNHQGTQGQDNGDRYNEYEFKFVNK